MILRDLTRIADALERLVLIMEGKRLAPIVEGQDSVTYTSDEDVWLMEMKEEAKRLQGLLPDHPGAVDDSGNEWRSNPS